jgi:putative inorganic carbon (HCO3(-)) transporter
MVKTDEPVVLHYVPRRRLGWGYRAHLEEPEPPHEPALDPEPEPEPVPRLDAAPGRSTRRRLPRPRIAWSVALPLLAAAVLGLLAGLVPEPAAIVLVVGATVAALLLRLEWAALVVVGSAVFEDYLARVDPRAIKLLAALLVVSWVVRRCRGRLHAPHRSPVLTATLVFVVVLALATAVHNNGATGQGVVLRYAGFIAVLLVLADVLRGPLSPARLGRAYVLACTVAAFCGLLTFALGGDRRAGGPVADPNDFAFLLVPAVALAIGLRGQARRRWPWDVATVLLVVAVLGTLSRGALVGLAVMALLALVAGLVRLRAAAGLAILVAGVVAVVVSVVPGLVSTSLQQKGQVADQNISERLDLWEAAGRMTVEHPVLGLGPGAFALHHDQYTTSLPDDVNHPLDVAHNTWLEVSSELGTLGLLAFLAILVTAFAAAWSTWRRRRDPLAAAIGVALVGTAAAGSFVTEQYYLPLWLLAALAVGVSCESSR